MTRTPPSDSLQLEILARDSGTSLRAVRQLYDQAVAALAEEASITNFIELLALRRVRYQLLPQSGKIH